MQEQRQYTRYIADGKAVLKVREAQGVRNITTELVDMCIIGIGVYSPEPLPRGTDINFVLMNKFWDMPIVGSGKVKYSLEIKRQEGKVYRVGVEFSVLAEKDAVPHIVDCLQKEASSRLKK